jgi:hypothetical protein
MSAINFPNSPSLNEIHFENNLAWKWNGSAWVSLGSSLGTPSGGIAYGNGFNFSFTAAGASGQFLRSNVNDTPIWTDLNSSYIQDFTEAVQERAQVKSVAGKTGVITLEKADVGLSNVEDTALSSWPGSSSISVLGEVTSGTWNADIISTNKGGTNSSSNPTAGAIAFGNGSGYEFSSTGASGQVLRANNSGAPFWADLAFIGTSPPINPNVNPFWFNSEDGILYINYNDGNSSQWVSLAGPKGDTGSQGAAGESIYIVGEAYIINEAGTYVTLNSENCWPAIIRCTSDADVTAVLQAGQTAYGRYWMLRQVGLGYITIAPTNSASESVTRNGNFKSFAQHNTLSAMIVAQNTLDIEGGSFV